jgi:hypothetical protein
VAERTARLSGEGLDAGSVRAARRELLSQAHAQRISQAVLRDPAAAQALLDSEGGLIDPARRQDLVTAIDDERTRVRARDGVAAGDDPARTEAYRAAALGLWHGARAARDAEEDAAWAQVLPHLTGGTVTAWTDLPAAAWRALSHRQQQAVRERTENPYAESDPAVLAQLKDMVAKDLAGFKAMDLGALYGVLAPEDAAEWRALQEGGRAGDDRWVQAQAQLALASRAVDLVDAGSEAPRQGFYRAIDQAQALKGEPLTWREMVEACQQAEEEMPLFWREPEAEPVQRQETDLRKPAPRRQPFIPDLKSLFTPAEVPVSSRAPKSTDDGVAPSAEAKRKEMRSILETTPEVRARFRVIAWAENARYNTLGGDTPGKIYDREFKVYPGRVSGRYQINSVTRTDFGIGDLQFKDFSPESQDLTAVRILQNDKIIEPLLSGDMNAMVDRAAGRWASFPNPKTGESKFFYKGTKKRQPSKK